VKKKRNALLITVVIHNAFESGEIWILNQLNIKKKFDKGNFEKKHVGKHCSKTKTMWGNIVTIHSVLKKKLWSKIDRDYFFFLKEKNS